MFMWLRVTLLHEEEEGEKVIFRHPQVPYVNYPFVHVDRLLSVKLLVEHDGEG